MGLARAFTRRLGRPGTPDESTKLKPTRPTISVPMGLISTTNQSVHENPNISVSQIKAVQLRQIVPSSGSSLNESDENTGSSPDTPSMTDASSVESYSPIEANHLTQYFPPVNKPTSRSPAASVTEAPQPKPESELERETQSEAEPESKTTTIAVQDYAPAEQAATLSPAPSVPRRAPSHSKQEHERLARVRSVRSSTGAVAGTPSLRNSTVEEEALNDQPIAPLRASYRPASDVATISAIPASIPETEDTAFFNPFSKELLQLEEVAEEFSAYSSERSWEQECEEDIRVMQEQGLRCHRASEYLQDISLLRNALWDLDEENEAERESGFENNAADDEDDEEQFHDALSDWI